MENIKNYLQFLCKAKIDEKHAGKLSLALKSYLARACLSARHPEIIQMNHYVDEYYAADKPKYKNIVLSPSRVPFPVAAFTNTFLVSKDVCKLFFINKKEEIEIHPYEYIIPVFVALFSGGNDLCCSSFIASVILCGEMAMKLVEAERLPIFKSTCVAMVTVIGHLWNLSSSSIAHVVDKILLESHDFSIQSCLEAISVASCSPNWFVDHYLVTDSTRDILSFLDQSMAEQKSRASFVGLDCLQFSVMGMSPVGSLLARVLYSHPVTGTDRVTISIPSGAWNVTGQHKAQQQSIGELEGHLSALIIWRGPTGGDGQRDLLRHSLGEKQSDLVSISLSESDEGVIGLDVAGERTSVSLSRSALLELPLEHVLLPQIIWDLQVVLGSCAADRVLGGIDSLAAQPSLVAALSLVFQRPALD